jgi:hypothetical protein
VQFDSGCTLSLTLFFWNNSTIFLIAHLILYKSGEFHYQCLQYGYWQRITPNTRIDSEPYQTGKKYKKNIVVTLGDTYYKGIEEKNSYRPDESLPGILYVSCYND